MDTNNNKESVRAWANRISLYEYHYSRPIFNILTSIYGKSYKIIYLTEENGSLLSSSKKSMVEKWTSFLSPSLNYFCWLWIWNMWISKIQKAFTINENLYIKTLFAQALKVIVWSYLLWPNLLTTVLVILEEIFM